jgi:hypothetical protein
MKHHDRVATKSTGERMASASGHHLSCAAAAHESSGASAVITPRLMNRPSDGSSTSPI